MKKLIMTAVAALTITNVFAMNGKPIDKCFEEDVAFIKSVTTNNFEKTKPVAKVLLAQYLTHYVHAKKLGDKHYEQVFELAFHASLTYLKDTVNFDKNMLLEYAEGFDANGVLKAMPKSSKCFKCNGKGMVKELRCLRKQTKPQKDICETWLVPCPKCFKHK